MRWDLQATLTIYRCFELNLGKEKQDDVSICLSVCAGGELLGMGSVSFSSFGCSEGSKALKAVLFLIGS